MHEFMIVRLLQDKDGFSKGTEGTLIMDYDGNNFEMELGPILNPSFITVSVDEIEPVDFLF